MHDAPQNLQDAGVLAHMMEPLMPVPLWQ